MDRRHFLATGALATASTLLPASAAVAATEQETLFQNVNFYSDGLALSPREYAVLLDQATKRTGFTPDNYSRGGAVEALETKFAARLGKEAAIFLPTGTLANHLAVRKLAGTSPRVLVQAESHLYNDTGDGAQALSGLTLLPLAPGETGFTLDEAKAWAARTAGGRVESRIGVLSIESPVRRQQHRFFDFDEMVRLCDWAREQGIRRHLDGARLFNLPQHTGRSVKEYAAQFDTVYVSVWKHFNGATGAMLAGDASFIDGLYHTRRMFGGALPAAWPSIAFVDQYLDDYEADYAKAWQAADQIIALLEASGRFKARKLENGTSTFLLQAEGITSMALSERAANHGVLLPGYPDDVTEFPLQVNTSLLRKPAEVVARALLDS
ncbi:MAG: beta-eliminating lyase-related protein [Pseudomonadota bacterium]